MNLATKKAIQYFTKSEKHTIYGQTIDSIAFVCENGYLHGSDIDAVLKSKKVLFFASVNDDQKLTLYIQK